MIIQTRLPSFSAVLLTVKVTGLVLSGELLSGLFSYFFCYQVFFPTFCQLRIFLPCLKKRYHVFFPFLVNKKSIYALSVELLSTVFSYSFFFLKKGLVRKNKMFFLLFVNFKTMLLPCQKIPLSGHFFKLLSTYKVFFVFS